MSVREMMTRYIVNLLIMLAFCYPSMISAENYPMVVVNPTINAKAFLPKTTLGAIFGMRLRKWQDGSPIKVFVLPDQNSLHIAFSKHVLRVFPHQLRSAWDRLVFSGTGEEPISVKTEQEMRTVVSSTPGAIGYLSPEMIDDTVKVFPSE